MQSPLIYSLISGKPLTEIKRDNNPERSEAETTNFQSTADITAEVPIVATAVSATVLIALIPAAFNHLINFSFIISPPKSSSKFQFLRNRQPQVRLFFEKQLLRFWCYCRTCRRQ